MPPGHGLRLHNQQHFGPARPELPQHGSEQTVHAIQFRTGPFAFQHGYLLAQGENLQRQIGSDYNEDAYNGHNIKNEGKHDVEVLSQRWVVDRQPTKRARVLVYGE
jgi:hypothetical protein